MAHLVETMVSAQGKVPWHGLGTVIDDPGMYSAQALNLAGLDWTVEKMPADKFNEHGITFPKDMHFNVRKHDMSVLGVVGRNYQVLQNVDAFQWGDDLLDESGAHWITAGSLKHGRQVWMMAQLPDTINVGGMESEKVQPYFLISNSHDGSSAITVALTMVRVVCNNTLTLALNGSPRKYKVRHTMNATNGMSEVRKALDLSIGYMDEFSMAADRLLNTPVNYESFLNELVPVPDEDGRGRTVAMNTRFKLRNIYENTPDIQSVYGTAWGALQAAVEYNDHHIKGRGGNGAEKRFNRILGDQPNMSKKAFNILTTV